MKTVAAVVLSIFGFIGLIALVTALGWFGNMNQLWLQSYFAPKFEQVRRETFEQSKAYTQGMIQELQNMQFQYVQANDQQKDMLADIILRRAADYNVESLPNNLYQFVAELRRNRTIK